MPLTPQAQQLLSDLSPRKAAFVVAYLKSGNSAEAARQAGYSCPNPHHASVNGSRLLRDLKQIITAIRTGEYQTVHADLAAGGDDKQPSGDYRVDKKKASAVVEALLRLPEEEWALLPASIRVEVNRSVRIITGAKPCR